MNEHIVEYCKDYINSEQIPNFALLIKGKWGCGKTYLVQAIIDDLVEKKKIEKKEIIQISLYGINSLQDLNERMYQALHPFLSSPQVQFAGMLLRSAIKFGTSIDINNDGKSDASISFGGIEKKKKVPLKDIKKRLIVIDDFERCDLEATVIFGFFSEMILRFGLKALFIGNEEEIQKEDEEEKKKYKRIKEKLIGIEFTLKPNLNDAIKSFVKELKLEKMESSLLEICLVVVNSFKFENLRNIRQCFYNLQMLLNILPKEANQEYITDVMTIFIVLFLQKNQGMLEMDNVNDAILAYIKYKISYKEYDERKKTDKDFGFMFFSPNIPLANCWEEIIFNGDYTKNKVLENYHTDNKKEEGKVLSTLFTLLNSWNDYAQKEFKELIDRLFYEIENGTYLHPGELMHFSNITLLFSQWGLIPNSKSEIQTFVLSIIEKYKARMTFVDDWDMLSFSYGGFGFAENIPEMKDIKEKLMSVNQENKKISIKKSLEEEIKILDRDVKKFVRNIIHVNGTGAYYDEPILSVIDINDFFNKLRELENSDINMIIHGFEERYGIIYSNKPFSINYLPDIENVKKLRDLFQASIGNKLYNPKALQNESIYSRLNTLYDYMASFRK
jgi:DNA polymerase III delta prime subunit